MKSAKSGKGSKGSSPIGHPKKQRESSANSEVDILQENLSAPKLAHLNSQGFAPGGGKTFEQMNHLIKLNTTSERWCVSYYIKSPEGKNIRKRAYGGINSEKDLKKRMELLIELQSKVFLSLKNGYDPLEQVIQQTTNIFKLSSKVISDKKTYLKKNSIATIEHHLGRWKEWLLKSNNECKSPNDITKQDILNYRNWLISKGISNRTVNNNMREVSGLFNYLIDGEEVILNKNPTHKIKKLPSRSEAHIAYTVDQFQAMIDYMKENDQILLFYIKLISFAYLRTAEAKRLKVGDIDLKARKITLTAESNKNNKRTHKIIQEIIIDEFESRNLSQYPDDYYLLSYNNRPGPIPLGENYFRKRFKKIKKKFGLTKLHTMYGFRHTSVQQLLEGGTQWHKAMQLTGHDNMESFQQYARSILGKEPDDMSSIYTVKL